MLIARPPPPVKVGGGGIWRAVPQGLHEAASSPWNREEPIEALPLQRQLPGYADPTVPRHLQFFPHVKNSAKISLFIHACSGSSEPPFLVIHGQRERMCGFVSMCFSRVCLHVPPTVLPPTPAVGLAHFPQFNSNPLLPARSHLPRGPLQERATARHHRAARRHAHPAPLSRPRPGGHIEEASPPPYVTGGGTV